MQAFSCYVYSFIITYFISYYLLFTLSLTHELAYDASTTYHRERETTISSTDLCQDPKKIQADPRSGIQVDLGSSSSGFVEGSRGSWIQHFRFCERSYGSWIQHCRFCKRSYGSWILLFNFFEGSCRFLLIL